MLSEAEDLHMPQTLLDMTHAPCPQPWQTGEKIPWHEPEFSARMLAQHLSQEHDWASRRQCVVLQQLACLAQILGPSPKRVLDLGCGPGLYVQHLAQQGHRCTGVDFSPASIDHARQQASEAGLDIDYHLQDVRQYRPGNERFELVMMLFGELNVFRPEEARQLLRTAHSALADNGVLLVEVSTFAAVREQGSQPATWEALEQGLFSAKPHLYLQAHAWDETTATASSRYSIIDAATAQVEHYGSTSQAYRDEQYLMLLKDAGFSRVECLAAADWPCGEPFQGKLQVYKAIR